MTDKYMVEFWPKPFDKMGDNEQPQATYCDTSEIAIQVEQAFHAIGWPARALKLVTTISRALCH